MYDQAARGGAQGVVVLLLLLLITMLPWPMMILLLLHSLTEAYIRLSLLLPLARTHIRDTWTTLQPLRIASMEYYLSLPSTHWHQAHGPRSQYMMTPVAAAAAFLILLTIILPDDHSNTYPEITLLFLIDVNSFQYGCHQLWRLQVVPGFWNSKGVEAGWGVEPI